MTWTTGALDSDREAHHRRAQLRLGRHIHRTKRIGATHKKDSQEALIVLHEEVRTVDVQDTLDQRSLQAQD